MGIISRPIKNGGTGDVVAGQDVLASEWNGDLNTIYNAFNGGIGTVNLENDAVNHDKLADHPSNSTLRAVGQYHIKDGAVVEAALGALAVTKDKVGPQAITLDKIKITFERITFTNAGPGSFTVTAINFNNTIHQLIGYIVDLNNSDTVGSSRTSTTSGVVNVRSLSGLTITGGVTFIYIDRT